MIRRTRQCWQAGQTVRVGFLQLRVLGARAVRDGLPDIYTLESLDGARRYEFIPHNGLTRLADVHAIRPEVSRDKPKALDMNDRDYVDHIVRSGIRCAIELIESDELPEVTADVLRLARDRLTDVLERRAAGAPEASNG